MNSTLYNGVSGIRTHQFGLDSTSNNIANINTTGYRANMPAFKSLFSTALSTANPASPVKSDMNYGATSAANAISNNDGSYKESDGEFSVAYAGKGWFVVGDNEGISFDGDNKKGVYFTRDGSFSRDAEGFVVNSAGYYMLGVDLGKIKDGVFISNPQNDEENLATSEVKPLQIPQNLHFGPTESTYANIALNLNANKSELNSYPFFLNENGEVDEEKLMNMDINALVVGGENFNATAYNSGIISVEKDGEIIDYEFHYEDFRTFKDLKEALEKETGLTLDFARNAEGKIDKKLVLEIKKSATDSTLDSAKISVGGKLFERLGMSGGADLTNFGFQSDKLAFANYKTTTEIFNDNGDKMLIISRYILSENGENEQVWSVESGIYTKDGETLIGEKVAHSIAFDKDGNAESAPITLTYGDKSVEYSILGSEKRKSSNVAYMDSAVLDTAKDGTQKGELAHIGIDNDGIISLSFTNGVTEKMGRVGVVAFVNDQGLQKVGGNLFEMAQYLGQNSLPASGAPLIGWDEKGALRFGQILHKYLESSNVNPADAMTDLIVYQRGYSMNAKAFTTGDDLIKEAINLKR
ncbi:flagellar hook-basal body complex protein [Helicobacter sp. 23-1044]